MTDWQLTINAVCAIALGWLADGIVPTIIAVLLILNLLLGIVVSIRRLRK
jgi:hypothetical protein